MSKAGSSGKGVRAKEEEEEDAALASVGQLGQQERKKKDITKVKCFRRGELGHFTTQCPRKKGKEEKSDSKAAPTKVDKENDDEDCAISAHAPLEKRCGDIEL